MRSTEYGEINELLQQLFLQIQSILAGEFVGMYIGGSVANNGFNFRTSDIDCYIITANTLPNNMINLIEKMHKKFYSSKLQYAEKIEASYIPQKDLLNFNPNSLRPYFNEGNFYHGQFGSNYLIELYVLRENGITIAGPDIKNLIKEISAQDLRVAIQKNLYEYWEVSLKDFEKFIRSDYQVFAILTMCRTLYSLETRRITPKQRKIRQKYSPQFKDQALERAAKDGVPKAAKDLGIPEPMLYMWRTKQKQGGSSLENQKLQQAEMARLKRENERL